MGARFSFSCLVFFAAAFALFAAEMEIAAVKPADIAGKRYILYSVDGKAFTSENQPFVEFDKDLNMAGAICNRFRGPATLENGILRTPGIVATRMMCPDENLSKLEPVVFKQLENGVVLRVEESDLIMQNAEIDLVFQAAYEGSEADDALAKALAGRRFMLKTMGGEQFVADDVPQPYIQFDENMRISGSACNQFSGQGRLRQGQLRVDQLASTLKMCINPLLMQFEGMFHMMLRTGGQISLDGKTLRMNGQGLQLEFAEE